MSQSIRISSGLSPILQRIPNNNTSSSSCMEVGFPIRKRAAAAAAAAGLSMVSNRNHPRLPFLLPCAAATTKSNVDDDDDDEGDTDNSSKGKYDPPKAWRTILSNFRSKFGPPQVTKGAVVLMIRMDLHDPIDGLKVLLDASRSWRMLLSLCTDELYDPEGIDDYGKSYLYNARKEGGTTNKRKHNFSPPTRLITRMTILRALADLNDPYNNGLEVMLGALEEWRALFSSNELNDSEGYLQKEIFAIRDLSQRVRIFVSNHNNKKHHKAKNRLPQLTHVMDILKLMVDNFEDPSDAVNAMSKAFEYGNGCAGDETYGLLVAAVAKLNF